MIEEFESEASEFTEEADLRQFTQEQLKAKWDKKISRRDEAIGLALSGGGYRATLMSLGVVLYLVDSGLNKRVRAITSVSGGSYTNALIAARETAFHAIEGEEVDVFEADVRAFIKRLTCTNIWSTWSVRGVGMMTAAVVAATRFFSKRSAGSRVLRWAVRLAGLVATLVTFDRRGRVLSEEVWKTVLDETRLKEPMSSLRRKGGDESIDHIICATNLANGRFVYMSGRFLYASGLGFHTELPPTAYIKEEGNPLKKLRRRRMLKRWGGLQTFRDIPMSWAVGASAALPIVIPPQPFPTGVFEKAGMWFVPPELRLVDGGVYDNLAVQWYRTADALRRNARSDFLARGEDPGFATEKDLDKYLDEVAPDWIFTPDLLVVVNAGGELKWTENLPFSSLPILREPIPVITEATELTRTAKIAFTAGTERRLYWLRREFRARFERDNPPGGQPLKEDPLPHHPLTPWKGTVVQIDHSPFKIPQSLETYPDDDVQEQARSVRAVLRDLGEDWPRRKRRNLDVPTYPHEMDPEDVFSLMYHGYVSAWANLHTLWRDEPATPPVDFESFKERFE